MEKQCKLNHLDLSVPDVVSAASFFEVAFGFMNLATEMNTSLDIHNSHHCAFWFGQPPSGTQ